MPSITDKLTRATDSSTGRPIIATLAAPGKTIGAASITLSAATNWTTTTPVYIALYTVTAAGVKDPTSQTDWKATLSGATLSNMTLTGGTDRTYAAGAIVEITFTAAWAKDLYDALAVAHNPDGSLVTAAVQTALSLGAGSLNGWNALGYTPNTVTDNGNGSYDMVFNGVDLTGTLSAGMRTRTTRTVAAPTQSTSLNGTTQYYSKTSPAGMTFTDDFVVSAWVKMSSYGAVSGIASRWNGTSGWAFQINQNGQIDLFATNAGSANVSRVTSYQSIPLNKWVHVAAQLDMSTFTATTTTSYTMLNGVDVPASVTRGGTNPTALIQAGNLEIGSYNATSFFPGKIAQVAIYSAKVTQATIRASRNQPMAGTETSVISAYSFNNTINDLNTTNANNLTANGSAVATNADSPFGGQASGSPSSTLDYQIVQKATFSTNTTVTVQVPEGCTIPTSGGVTSVVYSSQGAPYGFPRQRDKWTVYLINKARITWNTPTAGTVVNPAGLYITCPVGEWKIIKKITSFASRGTAGVVDVASGVGTSSSVMLSGSASVSYANSVLDVLNTQYCDIAFSATTLTSLYILLLTNQTSITQISLAGDYPVPSANGDVIALENTYL